LKTNLTHFKRKIENYLSINFYFLFEILNLSENKNLRKPCTLLTDKPTSHPRHVVDQLPVLLVKLETAQPVKGTFEDNLFKLNRNFGTHRVQHELKMSVFGNDIFGSQFLGILDICEECLESILILELFWNLFKTILLINLMVFGSEIRGEGSDLLVQ
jgi:hypothetical protein